MWIKNSCLTIAFMIFLAGCAVKQPTESAAITGNELSKAEKKKMWPMLVDSRILYETFTGKAKTKLNINQKSFNATSHVKIQHGEAIWISITAILGIEVARVLITPERIQIISRLQNEYIDKPFDYVYQFTSQELSFNEIEDLLIGNIPSFALDQKTSIFTTSNGFEIQGQHQALDFSMMLGSDYEVNSSQFNQNEIQQSLSSQYDQYSEISGQHIPGNVQIDLVAPKLDLTMQMTYSQVALNEELNLQFKVPSSYKLAN